MATCYQCGEEIEFINNGFGPIPIHPSGSCSGRGGGYGSSAGYFTFRTTSEGQVFEFPFVTYPSYVNPNARCPVCDASVYFYQSPYGGRVFFDELGPPWRKHPCTDNPDMRQHFSSAASRARFFIGATALPSALDSDTDEQAKLQSAAPPSVVMSTNLPAWVEAGWMPFIVTRIVPRQIGIEVEGKLFLSAKDEFLIFRIVQTSPEAKYYRTQGELLIGSDLVQNALKIMSVLNESPILLKQDPDLEHLVLSSFILTDGGEVQEITLKVNGVR